MVKSTRVSLVKAVVVYGGWLFGLRNKAHLNAGELKVLEGTHRTEPMGLLGGEVGLEKHTKKLKIKN